MFEKREFYIAGVQYHEMKNVIGTLEEGDSLDLIPEPSNKYDPNAVRIEVMHLGASVMLGYVPRKFSPEVRAALDIGTDLQCQITRLSPAAKPWEQCMVCIEELEKEEEDA